MIENQRNSTVNSSNRHGAGLSIKDALDRVTAPRDIVVRGLSARPAVVESIVDLSPLYADRGGGDPVATSCGIISCEREHTWT